jgi:hypothetical protein
MFTFIDIDFDFDFDFDFDINYYYFIVFIIGVIIQENYFNCYWKEFLFQLA